MQPGTNDAGEELLSVDDTLKQRGSRYGSFKHHSKLSKELRECFYKHHKIFGSAPVSDVQIEALNMIFHKLARIANGDPNYDDSWRDIAGYAQLVVDDINEG